MDAQSDQPAQITCIGCGQTFTPTPWQQKPGFELCTASCASRYRVRMQKLKQPPEPEQPMGIDQRGGSARTRAMAAQPRSTLAVVPGAGRPEPPSNLSAPEKVIWRQMVDAMPDGWFGPETHPMLRSLCVLAATSEWLDLRIQRQRNAENNWDRMDQAQAMLERSSKAVADLCTKLRLTPKSKYPQEKASHLQRLNSKPQSRPWDIDAKTA